ncbi:thioredoxin domain-containing protein [Agreia pratensis]|uniref:DsbA family protein n=1 Tax=Agreia pratensis TaxID=150121 RepID=UPI00188D5D36|nr:thioredoxin domain-containing protein [Agreia pratensis]MBF4632786.1 thioredoxin domain-containing protein [Agreia pratensis]
MRADKTVFSGLSKKERRDLVRELARLEREEAARRRRRRRIAWRAGLGVAGIAALSVGTVTIVSALQPAPVLGPSNMASDGILFSGNGKSVTAATTVALESGATPESNALDTTDGRLHLVVYTDYGSADSATFDTANGSTLLSWVTSGNATLELHPVALDDSVNQNYSKRAANAVACVADAAPDSVPAVNTALAAAQSTAGASGLTDEQLVALVQKAGENDKSVADCITSGTFNDWVTDATGRARASVPNSDVPALKTAPLVLVNGKAYTGALDDASAFESFVKSVYAPAADAPDPAPVE